MGFSNYKKISIDHALYDSKIVFTYLSLYNMGALCEIAKLLPYSTRYNMVVMSGIVMLSTYSALYNMVVLSVRAVVNIHVFTTI